MKTGDLGTFKDDDGVIHACRIAIVHTGKRPGEYEEQRGLLSVMMCGKEGEPTLVTIGRDDFIADQTEGGRDE